MLKNNKEYVILVNGNDQPIGIEEKIKAHKNGKMHRAFSIFIFNKKKELLIQKRAKGKYHSEGLWSNTVCGHPRPNELLINTTHRRLKEEMGFDCPLKKSSKFHYRVVFDDDLMENEIDTVFIGKYNGEIKINKNEVSDYKWVSLKKLKEDILFDNEKYTVWFKIIINKHLEKIKNFKLF